MFGILRVHQQRRRPGRLAMLLLCTALLFVQSLAHVHRAMHWPVQGAATTVAADRVDSLGLNAVDLTPVHAELIFLGLFKDHQDFPKCQLFDGVGSAPALVSATATVLAPAQGLIFSTFYNVFVVERLSTHFQARAPPYA